MLCAASACERTIELGVVRRERGVLRGRDPGASLCAGVTGAVFVCGRGAVFARVVPSVRGRGAVFVRVMLSLCAAISDADADQSRRVDLVRSGRAGLILILAARRCRGGRGGEYVLDALGGEYVDVLDVLGGEYALDVLGLLFYPCPERDVRLEPVDDVAPV
ncbi:hypothetical protein BJ138DRAFT_1131505 [Hygrophoropsis aurantiaca]|uniref:Uncharacterized protein n=1 Tax=Hygrophoropsis aurantiaca TaxID=72124 RepID=A0ACB7ZPI3_9AGAM|nr:hypothetical protein BJ138DRAFT_1131505 [Hygrophoropsis aurantiaca]